MKPTRTKRWNGKIDTLTVSYLKDVLTQMTTYGDRVQFGLTGTGQCPHYQLTNSAGKKMAFDSNNHLLHPKADEFGSGNVSAVFTLEQMKTAVANGGFKVAPGTRASSSVSRTSTAAVKAKTAIDTERYEYFKNNRKELPAGIGDHSDEIADLMKSGMSAEEAFKDVVKRCF